ncbi:MAG: YihY/virulence factor BrkB family protein [Vicinamibacteria bacterium]|nr:YihY/virulence factor BrkB family protein [Vicinamibacteria bacterium]
MTFADLRLLIDKSVNAWIDDYAPSMGAAIAYYTLFSVAPLIILMVAVAGMIYGQDAAEGEIVAQLQGRIGLEAAGVVQELIKSVSRPGAGAIASAVGIFTLLLGATSVFGELQSALNRIWRVPDPARRNGLFNLVRTRLLSFGMVLFLGLLLALSLAFGTFLSSVGEWSNHWFSGWQTVLQFANFLVSFLVNACIFAAIYKFMPRARIAWRDVGIGAGVTAFLLEVSKLLIGLYLGRSSVASSFGAAGSLVLFLVWVYLSAQIFLLGAEFTWVYSHQRGSRSERFETKVVPLVPSRAGDVTPEAKEETILRPRASYPLTGKVAKAAAQQIKLGASGAGRFLKRKPLLSVGLIAGAGLLAALILRASNPAARRERPIRPPWPD